MKAIERVKQYIDFKKLSNSAFEKVNGLSNGYIATQLKRNADLGESVLNKILDNCLEINPVWLLTGEGSMLKSEVVPVVVAPVVAPEDPNKIAQLERDNIGLLKENAMQAKIIEGLEFKIATLQKESAQEKSSTSGVLDTAMARVSEKLVNK